MGLTSAVRRVSTTVCLALVGTGLSVAGVITPAHSATPSPIVYAVNPFGNEAGYPGLTPFQLSTGAITSAKLITVSTGPFAGEPVAGANALAQDPTTNTFYAAIKFGEGFERGAPRHLATINVSTGQATTIGSLSRQIAGLAFRTDGTLYAVSGDGDANCNACLYTVNKITGALTLQKDLGTDGSTGEAIAYNADDDMIYHVSGDTFEKIDPDSAFAQTSVGFTGADPSEVVGIGFDGTNFVMTDQGNDVWSVTPAGAVTLVSDHDSDFFFRGLVVGSPVTVLDFGDAPDGVGTFPQDSYPTLSASTGASHVPVGPILGFGSGYPDAEIDALPTIDADGDDVDGINDEDGIVFHNDLLAGLVTNVRVGSATGGTLDGWIDYNRDGDWDDGGEQVFNSIAVTSGFNELSILIPSGATLGTSYARFRISTAGDLEPTGEAPNGEVEDYKVLLKQRLPGQKYRCGQLVKGFVKLNTDLLDCPEHGLVVKKSETTINLNGHTIDGIGNGAGVGDLEDKRDIVVKGRGGTIRDFRVGVSLDAGASIVRGVNVQNASDVGIALFGNRSLAFRNNVEASRDGIRFQANRVTVQENTVDDSSRDGIRHTGGGATNTRVIANIVSDSGEDGVDIDIAVAHVKDNEITNSAEDGLNVNGGIDVATITGSGNDTNGDPCLPARLCAV